MHCAVKLAEKSHSLRSNCVRLSGEEDRSTRPRDLSGEGTTMAISEAKGGGGSLADVGSASLVDVASASTVDVADFIDRQPVGGFQIRLLLTCAAVLFLDGFDTQAIGYVAPALAKIGRAHV